MYYFALSVFLFQLNFARVTFTEHYSDELYPFLVKIEATGKSLVCAGTILTSCTVLTSAHCVDGVDPTEVTVTHIYKAIEKYNVTSTVIHPEYNSTVLANDVALLQVKKVFKEPWTAVTLNYLDKEQVLLKCNFIEIVGWSGQIMKDPNRNESSSKVMEKPMRATVKLISNENCTAVIKNFGGIFQGEEKLCGVTNEEGEEERCFTGPGGPVLCSVTSKDNPKTINSIPQQHFSLEKKETLAEPIDLLENLRKSEEKKFKREADDGWKNLQVGVVSWGKSCSKVPSVYIRTDFYYYWITEMAKEMTEKCYFDVGTFSVLKPLKNGGGTFECFSLFHFVIFFKLITVLLRLL